MHGASETFWKRHCLRERCQGWLELGQSVGTKGCTGLGDEGDAQHLVCGGGSCMIVYIVLTHQTEHFERVNFSVCKVASINMALEIECPGAYKCIRDLRILCACGTEIQRGPHDRDLVQCCAERGLGP